MIFQGLYCPECEKAINGDEHVVLDFINTVRHYECADSHELYEDGGTLREITEKYHFFDVF